MSAVSSSSFAGEDKTGGSGLPLQGIRPKKMWLFRRKGPSGFSYFSTAEEVTDGIDGSNLTAIVTGASSGIGSETARVLALLGVHVVMGVRNVSAGNKVKEAIVKEIPAAKVDVMELDLSSLESVKKFTSQFKSSGHFLLTNLLLDTMKETAQKAKEEGRIVNISSEAHWFLTSEGIRFDRINDQEGHNRFAAYCQSKLANILHANELARRLREEGVHVTANSLHPGAITTNLFRHSSFMNGLVGNLGNFVFKNVQQGASTTCYVALHPQVKGISGEYFKDNNIGKASPMARDADLARRLWDFSMNMVKSKIDDS